MNEELDPKPEDRESHQDPDRGPDPDAHIRALLVELGSGPDAEPMPAEVAARLENTLARLVAEREASSEEPADDRGRVTSGEPDQDTGTDLTTSAHVVPLRRRWLTRMTAAAAAVLVLGAAGVAATNLGVFDSDQGVTADGIRSDSDAGGESAAQGPTRSSTPDSTPESTPDSARGSDALLAALPRVDGGSFESDVTVLLRRSLLRTPERPQAPDASSDPSGDTNGETAPRRLADSLAARGCAGPKVPDGAVPNPVRYEGLLALLVVHPERDGDQLVEAWTCDGDRRLASATLTP